MNPQELRIGNLFHPVDKSGPIHLPNTHRIMRVLTIELEGVRAIRHEQNAASVEIWDSFNFNEMSEIPITEDWLLKFGFEQYACSSVCNGWFIGHNPMTHDYLFPLVWMKNNDGRLAELFYTNGHFVIKYVHQLQNIYFALTGEELALNTPQKISS